MRDPSDLPEVPLPDGSSLEVGKQCPRPLPVLRLKRRADFLHAGKGKRWHGKTLSLHAAPARAGEAGADAAVARIGYTLTKKVGNAVIRNRARRRLKEAVRSCADLPVKPGQDYVIVGRIDAVRLPFAVLSRDVARAINDVHGARAATRRSGGDKGRGAKMRDAESGDLKAGDLKAGDIASSDINTSDAKPRDIRP